MAPSAVTDNYYAVLEVSADATVEVITKAYRRLALKLHPDRNANKDSTETFKRLGQAYETLKDESERLAYDACHCPAHAQSHAPQSAETAGEVAKIADLRQSKKARDVRWKGEKNAFAPAMFELQQAITRVKQEIENVVSIAKAEAAEDAKKDSWSTWLLSPLHKPIEESEAEKARKSHLRQERQVEKSWKERRLEELQTQLQKRERSLADARKAKEADDRRDDYTIHEIEARIHGRQQAQSQREYHEWRTRAQRERTRMEKEWQDEERQRHQRERREFERVEALRRQQADAERRTNFMPSFPKSDEARHSNSHRKSHASFCSHAGQWDKVHICTACPKCGDPWNHLMQCPSCEVMACPKCQRGLRRKDENYSPQAEQDARLRQRSPSPDYVLRDHFDCW